MNTLRNHRLVAHAAVFAVVLALLFFTTVRVSPITTDSASLSKVNLKQRNLKIDVAVSVSLLPVVVSFVPTLEERVAPSDQTVASSRFDGQYFNRPPPALFN
jgi:hypothetical protein